MLDSQCREVGVRNTVRVFANVLQEPPENLCMARCRGRRPDAGNRPPTLYLLPCHGNGYWHFEDPSVAHQTNEREQCRPGQCHWRFLSESLLQPSEGGRMLGNILDVGIDEKVRIDQDHLKASPSAITRALEMSSRSATRQPPSATGTVWLRVVSSLTSPSRSARWRTSSKLRANS